MAALVWIPPKPVPDDAHFVAMRGKVPVGAIFPPEGGTRWEWIVWHATPITPVNGTARSEERARAEVERRFAGFLEAAGLMVKP